MRWAWPRSPTVQYPFQARLVGDPAQFGDTPPSRPTQHLGGPGTTSFSIRVVAHSDESGGFHARRFWAEPARGHRVASCRRGRSGLRGLAGRDSGRRGRSRRRRFRYRQEPGRSPPQSEDVRRRHHRQRPRDSGWYWTVRGHRRSSGAGGLRFRDRVRTDSLARRCTRSELRRERRRRHRPAHHARMLRDPGVHELSRHHRGGLHPDPGGRLGTVRGRAVLRRLQP